MRTAPARGSQPDRSRPQPTSSPSTRRPPASDATRLSTGTPRRDPLRLRTLIIPGLLALALVAPVAAAAPVEVTDQTSPVLSYDLGEVTITQQAYGLDSRFHEMPVRVQGILAVPSGEGPFSVALIVHGSYPFCTAPLVDGEVDPYPCPAAKDLRQYEGFDELAAALAARGYLTLAPDVSAAYNNGFGAAGSGERAIEIIDAHLDALAAGSGLPVDVTDLADLDRLVLAGHSRGGPLAVRYSTDPTAKRGPRALALLAPAYLVPESVIPPQLPTALVIAECDEDVGTEQPLLYLERQLPPERPSPTVVYTLPGGTHHAFSSRLAANLGPLCTDHELMPPRRQRDVMATFLPDFFDLALGQIRT